MKTIRTAGRFTKIGLTLAVLIILLIIFTFLDLTWAGTHMLSLPEVLDALTGKGSWANQTIVLDMNVPRIFTGVLVGAGLAVTGCVMQAVFRNPLATPYILGLSSGASLGSAIAIMFIPASILSVGQPMLAFFLCILTTILVYMVSRSGGTMVRTETLVLAGVAISSLFSALVSLLTYISPESKMGSIVFWTMGNLSVDDTVKICVMAPVIVLGVVLMLVHGKNLNAMMIGDSHAMDLGVDVRRVRIYLLAISSVVVAACVAFVGTIGFVGLVIPHILRMVLGPDNRIIIPMSVVGGAAFLIISDYASHLVSTVSSVGILPIGVVTALVGAPFFVYLLCRRKREVGW